MNFMEEVKEKRFYKLGSWKVKRGFVQSLTFIVGLMLALGPFSAKLDWFSSNSQFISLEANSAKAVTVTFTASTTWTAPAGVTSVTVEAWGGGGGGGGQNLAADGGGGGGGGVYAKENSATTTPGQDYTASVGSSGSGGSGGCGTPGGDSYFKSTSTVLAEGGTEGCNSTGTPPAGGAGGASSTSVGDTKFGGGQGEIGRNNATGRGGYGGSSAGTAAEGFSGPQTWNTAIYPTSSTPTGGGDGGDGGNANGAAGSAPASGNGGGGGGAAEGTNISGGNGAVGKILITYPSSTVAATGTQAASMDIPSTAQYVGGAFSILPDLPATTTQITITENGTVNAQTGLNNILLRYDIDATAPYDCASVSYANTDTQFGSTDTDGMSSANGTSTFTGSVAVSSTAAMCVYVELDITSSAADSDTVDIRLATSSDVVNGGYIDGAFPVDIGGSTSLTLLKPNISAAANQTFTVSDGVTTISAITVTSTAASQITAANDIRIILSTSTTNFRWDTTDTLATISGSASSSASTTVSYEDASSTLVVNVTTNFANGESITISGLGYRDFNAVNAATSTRNLKWQGAGQSPPFASDTKTATIRGRFQVEAHSSGQEVDKFGSSTLASNQELFAFQLLPNDESASTTLTLQLSGISGITSSDITGSSGDIQFVQATSTQVGTESASLSATFGTAPTAGNTVIAAVSDYDAVAGDADIGIGAVTDNAGNTYTRVFQVEAGCSTCNVALFYAPNITTTSTFTITVNPGGGANTAQITLGILEYSGILTASPLDKVATSTGNSTSPSSGNITTTTDSELYIGVMTFSGGVNDAVTTGTTYTQRVHQSNNTSFQMIHVEDKIVAATTTSATWTLSPANPWGAGIASFKPATSSGPLVYVDASSNGTIDGGETSTAFGTGTVNITGATGTITFSTLTNVVSATSTRYILKATTANLLAGDTMTLGLGAADVSATGTVSAVALAPTAPSPPTNAVHTVDSVFRTQRSFRWQNDDGANVNSNTAMQPADTNVTGVKIGQRLTLRMQVDNDGGGEASGIQYKLQAQTNGTSSTWNDVVSGLSLGLAGANNDAITTSTAAANARTFVSGLWAEGTGVSSSSTVLANNRFTELGFMLHSALSAASTTYYLRLANADTGNPLDSYSGYPALTTVTDANDLIQYVKDSGVLPNATSGLSYFFDDLDYTRSATDDATYATTTSAANIPIFLFKARNATSSHPLKITWNGQYSAASTTFLDAYRFGSTNAWQTLTSTSTPSVNTDFTLVANLTTSTTEYYEAQGSNYWTYFRLRQGTTTSDLRTDLVNIEFVPWANSSADQTFEVNQASTSISQFQIKATRTPVVSAANDIRVKIPSSLNMSWATSTTVATLGGSAASKVTSTVSYPDSKTLLLNVTSDFAADEDITVSGLSFRDFTSASASATLETFYNGTSTGNAEALDAKIKQIRGKYDVASHAAGQEGNKFDISGTSLTAAELLSFQVFPTGENATTTQLVADLYDVSGFVSSSISSAELRVDANGNGAIEGGETATLGGTGTVALSGSTGSITFSSSFAVTSTMNLILRANVSSIDNEDILKLRVEMADITATGQTSQVSLVPSGTTQSAPHAKPSKKAGGGGEGGAPPAASNIGGGTGGGGGATGGAPTSTGNVGGGGSGGGATGAPFIYCVFFSGSSLCGGPSSFNPPFYCVFFPFHSACRP